MSDFCLDLRPQGSRRLSRAAELLRFAEDTRAFVVEFPRWGVAVTQTGDPELWAPYHSDDGSLVAVAGRPVFDEAEWDGAGSGEGGGLAAKIILTRYREAGVVALERLNGNCAVIAYDAVRQVVHLVTDRCGVFPAFEVDTPDGPLYCSHPDVLADAANEQHRLDEVSLAEFVLSGTLTPPFSYYERIRAADCGTVITLDVSGGDRVRPVKRRYFDFAYRGDAGVQEEELADQLAAALKRAVQRRTLPRLGPSVVALSGGLDSRAVLASCPDRGRMLAFCCYDEPNQELRTAEAIARSLSVPFLPLQRGADYYADHAERGVRISGGMGSFANNHFLGVIPRLKSEGMRNLLTGCYVDYLFKALPLNRRVHWLTQREELAPFRPEFYFEHLPASTPLAERAEERLQSRVPRECHAQESPSAVFQVEARRTFPLCYEGDNQQRVVPQRVTGWSPPAVDRDVVEIYCRLPYYFKMNRSIFRKVVMALAPGLKAIPDANTGAAADASPAWELVRGRQQWLRRRWQRLYRPAVSEESWPNWRHYAPHSPRLDALWNRPNPDAMDLFRRILGPSGLPDDMEALKRRRPFLFAGLLTQKLWLDQRA